MPLDIALLRRLRPQNELHYWASIGSTMMEAGKLAADGAPHGTVIFADEQTSGVGRLGRTWQSQPELGIYCSFLFRIPLSPAHVPVASLLFALATREAIQQSTNLVCDLRWPNDVLINERKVAGILAQITESCIIAGIGINVNHTQFSADLRTPATSVRIQSGGKCQSREAIAVALLEGIDTFASTLQEQGPRGILHAFASASTYAANRRIFIEDTGAQGTTVGLDEHGFLLVRLDSGEVERLSAGGVRPVR